ncbi:MAG: TIGR02594 family protein [Bacteroidota bacterium]
MQELIRIAAAEIGTTEVVGVGSNERIMTYAKEVGFDSWYHDDDTPWCSLFLNWVAHSAGASKSNDGRAASWSNIGSAISRPNIGDVVLLTSRAGNTKVTHVGLYVGHSEDGKRVHVLGGNQSNMVNIAAFPLNLLIGYRRLSTVGDLPASEAAEATLVLRRGDRGTQVKLMQKALAQAGFSAGKPDGAFGPNTEKAVIAFQQSQSLPTHGVYDAATQEALVNLGGAISTR